MANPFRFLTGDTAKHVVTIIVKVIAGLILASLLGLGGYVYANYRAEHDAQQFLTEAEALIRRENYSEVRMLSQHLAEPVRNHKDVEFMLLKAEVFASALEKDVNGFLDSSTLGRLRSEAEFLDARQKTAETAALLGIVDNLRDNPKLAHREFAEALHRDPNYANAYNYWGYSLMQWELPEDSDSWQVAAEKNLRKAVKLSSSYEWPVINLGELALLRVDQPSQADYESANKSFLQAESIAPENPNSYMDSAVCLLNIGVLYQQAGDPARATEYLGQASKKFRKATELGLDSAMLHNNWGYLFESTGDPQRALEHYDKALRLNPTYVRACKNRAELQEKLNQSAKGSYVQCRELLAALVSNFHQRAGDSSDPAVAARLRALEAGSTQGLAPLDEKIHELDSSSSVR